MSNQAKSGSTGTPVQRTVSAEHTSYLLPAIALTLFIHAFVMAIAYLLASAPGYHPREPEPLSEFVELELAPESQDVQEEFEQPVSEEVRNLLASQQAARTSDKVNYTGKSKADMAAEVEAYYKNLEAAEYERLASERGDVPPVVPDQTPKQQQPREDYSYLKNGSQKSYSGSVAANYDLKNRNPHQPVPKPTYLCKSAGVVVVGIEVDQSGAILRHWLIEEKSSLNECLREQSLKYAAKWHFDYSASAPKKQTGSITFTFSAQ